VVRHENPYNQALAPLTAFMEFELSSKAMASTAALKALKDKGGTLQTIDDEGLERHLVKLSHKHIDGRGLTYLFNELYGSNKAKASSVPGESFTKISEVYNSHGFWLPSVKYPPSKLTFTLKLAVQIIKQFPQLKEENIGFVVNLESFDFQSLDAIWGNSIIVTPIPAQKVLEYEYRPKREWKEYLKNRAHRTLKIMRRKAISDVNFDSLVISSIGDLTGLPWLTSESSTALRLGATPSNPKTLNVFVWSNHQAQSLLFCGSSDQWLFKKRNNISELWKKMFIKK